MAALDVVAIAKQARQASYQLASMSTAEKNRLLQQIVDQLMADCTTIVIANQQDYQQAQQQGLDPAMLDRLLLDETRLQAIINDLKQVIQLADPIGKTLEGRIVEHGLKLTKVVVPLGVVACIYEARPNVTIDIAGLCLKTGNCVILRGGKESLNTNRALYESLKRALLAQGIDVNVVQLISEPDRQYVTQLLQQHQSIDMLIPRGGAQLQTLCQQQATMPVILGGVGVCHIYIDSKADLSKVVTVIENAKVQRPTVCNALDTLLIHRDSVGCLPVLLPLLQRLNVKIHGDQQIEQIAKDNNINIIPVTDEDWSREWVSLNLNIKIVESIADAIAHIHQYGSGHSEAILTDDLRNAAQFVTQVDAAAVYVNASTRFTDGSQFGLGAEVAVSTQKLHARGPMGLDALTTYKWIGIGDYTVRQ